MKLQRLCQRILRLCVLLILVSLAAMLCAAQQGGGTSDRTTICPLNEQPIPDGLKIASVKVTGRRGVGPVEEELRKSLVGQTYTRDLHRNAMQKVEEALTKETNESFEKQAGIIGGASHGLSGAAFLRTDPCIEIDNTSKSVDVIVRVLFLRLDLRNLANNLLTLPRSLKPSFYDKMPAVLRVFNPQANIDFDRRTGAVASLDLSTNLLELRALSKGEEISDSDVRLDFSFSGQKSLGKPFYRTKTDVALSKIRPSQLVEQLDLTIGFRADDQPLSEMRYVNNALRVAGQIKLRPRQGLLSSVYLSGTYSRNTNKVYEQSGRQSLSERDNTATLRSIIDGRVRDGFARMGVWFEAADVTRTSTNYQRLAGLFAYQKEIGAGTQTFGIETMIGGGKTWGAVPLYARFFGGNNAGSFLYDTPNSVTMTDFPVGPLLRSYGKTQAGARSQTGAVTGGRSYWHANLNLSIPVRPWSRRLIPDEVVVFEDGDMKLNELLESFTIKTAIGTIAGDLIDPIIDELQQQDPTLDDDEAAQRAAPIAEERARKIVEKEVGPTIRYVARHANLYAFKPLIMLDAAQIGGVEGERRRLRFAAGGGVQFVLVIARAELGYMRSFPTISGEPKGNFVFRLTFQNLF